MQIGTRSVAEAGFKSQVLDLKPAIQPKHMGIGFISSHLGPALKENLWKWDFSELSPPITVAGKLKYQLGVPQIFVTTGGVELHAGWKQNRSQVAWAEVELERRSVAGP